MSKFKVGDIITGIETVSERYFFTDDNGIYEVLEISEEEEKIWGFEDEEDVIKIKVLAHKKFEYIVGFSYFVEAKYFKLVW